LRHLRSNEGQSGQTEEEIIKKKKKTIWSVRNQFENSGQNTTTNVFFIYVQLFSTR
jgi:hypothetical protein